jgi:UDP-N-acetyl-2-amino-2-deoxyglucuronate dehydrogenase
LIYSRFYWRCTVRDSPNLAILKFPGRLMTVARKVSMIRFGLLGCGRIAKRHSDLLGGHHVDRASLAGVPIRTRADAIPSKFGALTFYDIDDFLARADILMWWRS